MAGEFSAPISLEPLPYTVARAADPADVEVLQKQASVEVFTRTDGVILAVFSTKWRLENVVRDNPGLHLRSLVAAGE
jgi:peptide chain release factor 3